MSSDIQTLALGPNSVMQRTMVFEKLQTGKINRAQKLLTTPGGKGIHFALAANRICPGSCTVAHFLGGDSGKFINSALRKLSIPHLKVTIPEPSRICTTLLCADSGEMTELIDPSPQISRESAVYLREGVISMLQNLNGLALCGTQPPGAGDLYRDVVGYAKGHCTVLLDGYRDVQSTLDTGNVDLLKINIDELSELCGSNERLEDAALDEAADAQLHRFGLKGLALTDGPGRAYYYADDGRTTYELPVVDNVRNPIGAGDTVGAVFLTRLLAGKAAPEAFADGLAAASMSCLHLEGARFTVKEMENYRQRIQIRTHRSRR